jgi:hypothetical protein
MRAIVAGEQRMHSTSMDELFLGLLIVISLAMMARLSVLRVFRPEEESAGQALDTVQRSELGALRRELAEIKQLLQERTPA